VLWLGAKIVRQYGRPFCYLQKKIFCWMQKIYGNQKTCEGKVQNLAALKLFLVQEFIGCEVW
jgi:hypothetical protein